MATLQLKRTGPDTCTIVCEHCRKGKELHSDKFRQLPSLLKVKCGCGQVSHLEINRRRFTRLSVELPGTLSISATQERLGTLTITELSLQGVSFVSPLPDLEVGQTYYLDFVLDDNSKTLIGKDIVVRHTQADRRVGAEFLCLEDYDFALDFYLMTAATLD